MVVGGTNPTRTDQLLDNDAAKNDLLAIAQKSTQAGRSGIAKRIDAAPLINGGRVINLAFLPLLR